MSKTKEQSDTQHEPFESPVLWREVIRRHSRKGGHYFDDDTMQFFDSHLHETPQVGPDGYAYGVVSSKKPDNPRLYQVIRCAPDGSVERPHPEEKSYCFALRLRGRAEAIRAADALSTESEDDLRPGNFRWY
jgi:hypothetical protein